MVSILLHLAAISTASDNQRLGGDDWHFDLGFFAGALENSAMKMLLRTSDGDPSARFFVPNMLL